MSALSPAERLWLRSYRMPPEWAPHLATYLVWPHNRETWPGKFAPIPGIFARLAAAIAHFEPVRILINEPSSRDHIRKLIGRAATPVDLPVRMDRIELIEVPTNDAWIRDHGPIFVNRVRGNTGPAQIALDWRFNSWGEKYGACDLDDAVPQRLAERYGFPVIEPGLVLEGGSIEVNGAGSLLTTEACLLNPNRNPHLDLAGVEEFLRSFLGVTQILWLGEGIAGDDTNGHVDDLARFVAADTIVTVSEDDPVDANYQPLRDNLRRLRRMRNEAGQPFRIERLPMPPAAFWEGTRLPASYANFLIVNGGVIVPTFDCPADAQALATLERLLPGRRAIGIPSTDLVWGLGAVHCLTQQHPAPHSG